MKFKEYQNLTEANVDVFDDVKKKATKEIFKVVDILIKAGQRFFKLSPTGQKNAKEFEVDNKTFNKEYMVI